MGVLLSTGPAKTTTSTEPLFAVVTVKGEVVGGEMVEASHSLTIG